MGGCVRDYIGKHFHVYVYRVYRARTDRARSCVTASANTTEILAMATSLSSFCSGHAVCLFSQRAEKQKLCSRISDLLNLPVAEKDDFLRTFVNGARGSLST